MDKQIEVNQLIKDNQPENYNLKWVVLLVWESPISNILEHRTGAFDSYIEADMFARHLDSRYKELNLVHSVYIIGNGQMTFI